MSDLTIKSGDRYPIFFRVPGVHFTDQSVRLVARRGSNPTVNLTTSVEDGAIKHILDGAMDVTGEYRVELEISHPDGGLVTAPTDGYATIRVIADLD